MALVALQSQRRKKLTKFNAISDNDMKILDSVILY